MLVDTINYFRKYVAYVLHRILRKLFKTAAPVVYPLLPGSSRNWGPPRKYSFSVSNWISSTKDSENSKFTSLIPSINFTNTAAIHIEKKLPANLKSPAIICSSEQFVVELNGGRVVGSDPAIISNDDSILLDLSMYFAPYCFDIFFTARFPPLTISNNPVLVLAGLPGANYGHWLHQMLPRLHLAELAGWKPSDFEFVIINSSTNCFADETLIAAGFAQSQIVKVNKSLNLEGSPLVVPSIPGAGDPPKWIPDFLRTRYSTPHTNPNRRIFASRRNARWRKIINEAELYPTLLDFKFEIFDLEKLTFKETVRLFEESNVVCGLHGANLSNICFCPPNSTLIEIYHPQHPELYYWTTATSAGLNYAFMLGEGELRDYPDLSPNAIGNHTDLYVDPRKLYNVLLATGLK